MKYTLTRGLFVYLAVFFVTSSASAAAVSCTTLTKALSKGSESNEVLKLQQFLFDTGYLNTKPNGYFGNGTLAAVKLFQQANNISPIGTVGPATRSKIKIVSCANSSIPSISITVPSIKINEQPTASTVKKTTISENMERLGYTKIAYSLKENPDSFEKINPAYDMSSEQAKDYEIFLFANKKSVEGVIDYKLSINIKNIQKEGRGGITLVNANCDSGVEVKMLLSGDVCKKHSAIGSEFRFSNNEGDGGFPLYIKGKGKVYLEFIVNAPTESPVTKNKYKAILYKGITFDVKEVIPSSAE